jgi:sugar phosphate isomerase/epimerase
MAPGNFLVSALMRPLSLDHLTIIDATPLELIEAAAAGGFEKVGLRIVKPLAAAAIVEVVGQPQLQRELKALMAATGVSVGLIESIWLSADATPAALEPALAAGAELGARFVLVGGNDPDEKRLIDNLGRLAGIAQTYGLEIAFEFMPFTQVRSYEDALRIKRALGVSNVRLLIDALHLSRSGRDLRALDKFDSAIVSYVHLCDAPAAIPPPEGLRDEARLGRLYPGEGELRLHDFLDAMPDDAPIGVEAPCRAYAHLPPLERGKIAGRVARAFMQRHEPR